MNTTEKNFTLDLIKIAIEKTINDSNLTLSELAQKAVRLYQHNNGSFMKRNEYIDDDFVCAEYVYHYFKEMILKNQNTNIDIMIEKSDLELDIIHFTYEMLFDCFKNIDSNFKYETKNDFNYVLIDMILLCETYEILLNVK